MVQQSTVFFSTLHFMGFPELVCIAFSYLFFNLQTVQRTCYYTKETVSCVLTSVAESSPVLQVSVSVGLMQRLL